jgi:hypothetical protein
LPFGGREKEHTVIVKPGRGYDDYHSETFTIKEVVAEMMHEVSLALYGAVEMVV